MNQWIGLLLGVILGGFLIFFILGAMWAAGTRDNK